MDLDACLVVSICTHLFDAGINQDIDVLFNHVSLLLIWEQYAKKQNIIEKYYQKLIWFSIIWPCIIEATSDKILLLIRVFGQVFQEDVDGGATVNCKQPFFQHDGLEAN